MQGLKPISDAIPGMTQKAFGKKHLSLGRIITQWEEIMGKNMAARATPIKINYRKNKRNKNKPEASLEISISSADATTFDHQKGIILERINQLFGNDWITSIKFVHDMESHIPRRGKTASRKKSRRNQKQQTIDEEERKYLDTILEEITDNDIKKRLESLGTSIIQDTK